MLSHSVNTSQTASLLASGLPNSAPVAQDAIVSLAEDTCAPLPTLTNLVSDWDIGPPLYRAQTLSIQLNVTSLTRGSLHDDAACASAALSGSELPYRAGLHYRPRPDEYGADYDVLKWSVSDNTDSGSSNGVSNTGAASESVTGGSHNASAVLRFNVSSVNDAPIAHDTSATVYVDFPQMLRLNGSDVDETSGGTDGVSTPTDTLATHSFSVSTLPSFGELHSLNAQGGLGPPLALGALTPGVSLFYTATADFGDTSGQMVLGSDFFDYVIIDALGATHVAAQGLRHFDAAVSLLVVLQHGNQRAAYRKARAVQCVHQLRLAGFRVTPASLHAAGLKVAAVGARGNLAVLALTGNPDFQIVGLLGAEAHVAAAQRLIAGEPIEAAYNLGSQNGLSVREIMDAMARVTGIAFTPEVGPRRPGDPDRIVATGELAARDLDWQMRYSIDEMVRTDLERARDRLVDCGLLREPLLRYLWRNVGLREADFGLALQMLVDGGSSKRCSRQRSRSPSPSSWPRAPQKNADR